MTKIPRIAKAKDDRSNKEIPRIAVDFLTFQAVRFRGKRHPQKPRSSTEPLLNCLTGYCGNGFQADQGTTRATAPFLKKSNITGKSLLAG
jgi:hypothetical protein